MLQIHAPAAACDSLALARRVLRDEAAALEAVADRLDESFERAADLLESASGRVVVSGVGKSADVGRKIVATFNSTGTRSFFLDPTAARHGDLGAVDNRDVALLLSHGGESVELVAVMSPLVELTAGIAVITSNRRSTLARAAKALIAYGPVREADPLGLAPSSSTTVMVALGDALAFELARRRDFSANEFARFHPAGSLGLKLARVEDHMRCGSALRLARPGDTVREVFARPGRFRRTGAVLVLTADGRLAGLFTDSDLARLFERRADAALDRPIRDVMTCDPLTVVVGSPLTAALELFRTHRISELPVLDPDGRVLGLLDATDLFSLMPDDDEGNRHAA